MSEALGTAILISAAGTALAITALRVVKPNADVHPGQYVYKSVGYRNTVGASENLRSGTNRKLNTPKAVETIDPLGMVKISLPTATAVNPVYHGFKMGKPIASH